MHSLSQKETYATNCSYILTPAKQTYLNNIDIYVCTIGNAHVLNHLKIPRAGYFHKILFDDKVNPLRLPFLCQHFLRDIYIQNKNKYDFFCYLDDDIIIKDTFFFHKLRWINRKLANSNILIMPNVYERSTAVWNSDLKLYTHYDVVDGNAVARFQNLAQDSNFSLKWNDMDIQFFKPYNPYSASYFLSNERMRIVVEQGNFDKMIYFAGPLESA